MALPPLLSRHPGPQAAASIDLIGATALGVRGMMGPGLYTLLGLAARSAGVLLPLAFLLAGTAASFSVYSYARLGTAFPSRGGGAHFLLAALGDTKPLRLPERLPVRGVSDRHLAEWRRRWRCG